eukprot:TRINITY_DN849_c0_g2_i1.p1 TRINITY_DN849_c0_g2~~TRINITY_DN849_c0_g2_i1.p1  ORF type:complete len:147 (+),score=27.58 TRINITY_DN849_c0_g2_i1:171-611(+)
MSEADAAAAATAEAKPRRKPGLAREFVLPQDPTTLPDMNEPRIRYLQTLVERQEKGLAESQSALARIASEGQIKRVPAELPPASFSYDCFPTGAMLSENQASYFPRSLGVVKDCGGGRDRRFCRMYDGVYIFREAWARQKDCLTAK